LLLRKKKAAGRNNTGRITVNHQGGGHKQLYRQINFFKNDNFGTITNIEYDPNRTAFIAKICFQDVNNNLTYNYIISPQKLKVLDVVFTTENKKQLGNFYFLKDFDVGDFIYNIELNPNKGAQIVRAAGAYAKIINKTELYSTIELPSGEYRLISNKCKACLGNISNENHRKVILKKAGRSRWLNKRPTVRGVAMNPIDHPHGGNTSGGRHPKTPWARLTKGVPTRSKKKKNKMILKSKKKKKILLKKWVDLYEKIILLMKI